MKNTSRNHLILASTFILLLAAPACLADLMCYVCDDCAKLQKDTPLLACNEDFFNQGGSTEASTVTTTESSTTEELISSNTDATPTLVTDLSTTTTTTMEPTTTVTEELTTMEATTDQTTPESTEAPMPTPATAGPPDTTPGVPTPPAEDLQRQMNTTRLLPMLPVSENPLSTELPIRQRRALINTSVSYHCYTVQKTINNTVLTQRGCSRVEPLQSVCAELQVQNNSTQLSHCDPCTMNACNGATSALQSSLLATLLVAVVAAALQRN